MLLLACGFSICLNQIHHVTIESVIVYTKVCRRRLEATRWVVERITTAPRCFTSEAEFHQEMDQQVREATVSLQQRLLPVITLSVPSGIQLNCPADTIHFSLLFLLTVSEVCLERDSCVLPWARSFNGC